MIAYNRRITRSLNGLYKADLHCHETSSSCRTWSWKNSCRVCYRLCKERSRRSFCRRSNFMYVNSSIIEKLITGYMIRGHSNTAGVSGVVICRLQTNRTWKNYYRQPREKTFLTFMTDLKNRWLFQCITLKCQLLCRLPRMSRYCEVADRKGSEADIKQHWEWQRGHRGGFAGFKGNLQHMICT